MYRSNKVGYMLSVVSALAIAGGPIVQSFCSCGCMGEGNSPAQTGQEGRLASCCKIESSNQGHSLASPKARAPTSDTVQILLQPFDSAPESVCCCKNRREVLVPPSVEAKSDSQHAMFIVDSYVSSLPTGAVFGVWREYCKPPPSKRPLYIQFGRILT